MTVYSDEPIRPGDVLPGSMVYDGPNRAYPGGPGFIEIELVPVSREMAYRNNWDLIDWGPSAIKPSANSEDLKFVNLFMMPMPGPDEKALFDRMVEEARIPPELLGGS